MAPHNRPSTICTTEYDTGIARPSLCDKTPRERRTGSPILKPWASQTDWQMARGEQATPRMNSLVQEHPQQLGGLKSEQMCAGGVAIGALTVASTSTIPSVQHSSSRYNRSSRATDSVGLLRIGFAISRCAFRTC